MRAIKAGVDPRGIMNTGTLLPPPNKVDSPSPVSTISAESLDEWVVKPESLSDPAELDPEGGSAEVPWYEKLWSNVRGLGSNAAKSVGVSGNEVEGKVEEKVEENIEGSA